MVYEYYDKFEYKISKLYSSLEKSIEVLNTLGTEGWELHKLIFPTSVGEQYSAILIRKIMSIKV